MGDHPLLPHPAHNGRPRTDDDGMVINYRQTVRVDDVRLQILDEYTDKIWFTQDGLVRTSQKMSQKKVFGKKSCWIIWFNCHHHKRLMIKNSSENYLT
jgi:hypothetical protein